MKLSDLLTEAGISVSLAATDKRGVIEELVDLLIASAGDAITDRDAIIKAVWEREELMSTGIGQGVGIPHAKTNAVSRLHAVFAKSQKGIEFSALDGKPVSLFFLLIAPEDQSGPHVKALARISRLLKQSYFRQALIDATKSADVLTIIREEEFKSA